MSIDRERLSEDKAFHEETAAEFVPSLQVPANRQGAEGIDELADASIDDVQEGTGSGTTIGIVGLVLSLASLFILPFLLSLIGIGAGFFASRRGARSLGRWAIGIGVISLIGSMLFAPFLG